MTRTPGPPSLYVNTLNSGLDGSHTIVMPGWGFTKLAYSWKVVYNAARWTVSYIWGSSGDGEMLGRGLEVKCESRFGDKCDFRGS